jgi:hypothetical protein
MTTLFREHPPARPVTGFTIERYINFPADQKRPDMPGPIVPTTPIRAGQAGAFLDCVKTYCGAMQKPTVRCGFSAKTMRDFVSQQGTTILTLAS